MVHNLRKRTILILTLLLGAVYLTILISVNIFNYSSNLREQRRQIRELIQRVGVDAVCEYPRTDSRLEDVEYCVVMIDESNTPSIISNYMPDYSEQKLLKYSKKIVSLGLMDSNIHSLVYVTKSWKTQKCNVIVFMNNDFAVKNSENLIIFSVVAFVIGMILLFAISLKISKWLMVPTEKTLEMEKEFMSNASHELKTPLTIISANAELLKAEYGDNQQLSYIRQETSKMNHLIGEMLMLVRMDSVQSSKSFSEFDLSGAMTDVVLSFESVAFENKLKFDFNIDDGLRICANQEQMRRVMSILLDNAMSYTPKSGNVFVEVTSKNKKIILKVCNTGDPITEEMRQKIFERFYRQNESRESGAAEGDTRHFGLGLSIANSIVKHHSGTISVKSAEGVNTFLIVLPMAR